MYVRVFEWNDDEGWKRAGGDVETGQDLAGELCLSGDGKRLALGDPNGCAVRVYRWNATNATWDQLGDANYLDYSFCSNKAASKAAVTWEKVSTGVNYPDGFLTNAGGSHESCKELCAADANCGCYTGYNGWCQTYRTCTGTEKKTNDPSAVTYRKAEAKALEQPSGSDFGHAVSLSRDGSVLAVGAPDGSGSVRVFRWDASRASWSRMGVDIVGPHGTDVPARLGAAVSLSLDGTRLAAAAPGAGVALVFGWNRASSSWSKMGGDSTAGAGRVLTSIALSGDGTHLAVGAPDADDGVGVVAVYRWTRTRDANGSTGSTWEAAGESGPLSGAAAGDRFGSTVSLSRDGSRLAVGAERGVDGYVRVFDWNAEGSSWRMAPAVNLDGAPGERFGRNARLSGAGAILAVGRNQPDGSGGGWVIPHALECDAEAAGAPPNGRTGTCGVVARLLNVTGSSSSSVGSSVDACAPVCDDGFELTEPSVCDPFTGGFRSGRCLCPCDVAWRDKGFYM